MVSTDGTDLFLQAEEEANRLIEVLAQLKKETESYRTSRQAMGEAAEGVGVAATRLADVALQLGSLGETLRSIGTPELLRAQKAVANQVAGLRAAISDTQQSIAEALGRAITQVSALQETVESAERNRQEQLHLLQQGLGRLATAESVATLRDLLEQREEEHRREIEAIKKELGMQQADTKAAVGTVRNLALGTVGLLVIAVALLGMLLVSIPRG